MLSRLLLAARRVPATKAISLRSCITSQFVANVSLFSTKKSAVDTQGISGSDEARKIADCFSKLNTLLENPRQASSDDVIEHMRALIDTDIQVPLAYYLDSIRLFTSRRDILRTELLIRMCHKNLKLVGPGKDPANAYRFNRSAPEITPFQQVVSLAIAELSARGVTEDAMRLWVSMASLGYVTNRVSLYEIISKMQHLGGESNLKLLDKVHGMVKAQLWDDSPHYNNLYLGVLRQNLQVSCKTLSTVKAGMHRVDTAFEDMKVKMNATKGQGAVASHTLLRATYLQCLLTAEESLRLRCVEDHGENLLKEADEYSEKALAGFYELLKEREATSEASLPIWEEIFRTFDLNEDKMRNQALDKMGENEIPKAMHQHYSSDHGEGARNGRTTFTSLLSMEPGATLPSDDLQAQAIPRNLKVQNLMESSKPAFAMRSVVHNLIKSLCQRGQTDKALDVLKKYLELLALRNKPNVAASDAELALVAKDDDIKSALRQSVELMAGKTTPMQINMSSLQPLSHHNTPPKLSYGDAAWARFLIGEAVENTFFPALDDKSGDTAKRKERYVSTEAFVGNLQNLATSHGLTLGPLFYRRRVAQAAQCLEPTDWNAFERQAYMLIDSVDDKLGRTPQSYGALVHGLANNYDDPKAVHRALRVVFEMVAEKITVLPAIWASLLQGASQNLNDSELSDLLGNAEDFIRVIPEFDTDKGVLEARLAAHCRLSNGYQCLELLKSLREKMPIHSPHRVTRHTYVRVINSIYHMWPAGGEEHEWSIVMNPHKTTEYLMREMYRDGLPLTQNIVATLLKLYTKKGQIQKGRMNKTTKFYKIGHYKVVQADLTETFRQANNFLWDTSVAGFMGHKKVPIGQESIREMVKLCCVMGDTDRAMKVLEQSKEKYGVDGGSWAWEPLVHNLAVIQGNITAAKDVITLMNNANLKPTQRILDSLVRVSELPEALDKLEEIFYATGARPAPATLLSLLDLALLNKDVNEAQRVCSTIHTLYTEEERLEQKVGISTTARQLGQNRAYAKRSEQIDHLYKKELTSLQEKIANMHADGEEYEEEMNQMKKLMGAKSYVEKAKGNEDIFGGNEPLSGHYRLREMPSNNLITPGTKMAGRVLIAPLSTSVITRRFADAGIKMPRY